jgi:UDP-N-acetyl-D-glucosamine dehydrogenase
MQRVVILGQGYVGLPLAMRAVEVGHHVVGYDVDDNRVKRLGAGESYVEDISSEVLAAALATGRYQPTSDSRACAGFDVAVITVPTPLNDGAPDLTYIEQATATLAPYLRRGATVVLESTTYPGTTEELVLPGLEAVSGLEGGTDFYVGYSPERIDPGNARYTLRNTPKVVSGVGAASLEAVRHFYDSVIERTVPVSSPKVAELVKLLENTFRHVNIALVNELAMFAAELDVDVWEAIDAASTKPFGFLRFTPGPGVGGHCLPIDPSYLSWRVRRLLNQPFRFVELANDINEHMPDYVVNRLVITLNRQRRAVNGSRILLLGLAYKRNTSDGRESPAVAVAERLVALGADVRAADPHVLEEHTLPHVHRVEATREEVAGADAVVLLTDHDAFDYPMISEAATLVLDTRHRLPPGDAVEYL